MLFEFYWESAEWKLSIWYELNLSSACVQTWSGTIPFVHPLTHTHSVNKKLCHKHLKLENLSLNIDGFCYSTSSYCVSDYIRLIIPINIQCHKPTLKLMKNFRLEDTLRISIAHGGGYCINIWTLWLCFRLSFLLGWSKRGKTR